MTLPDAQKLAAFWSDRLSRKYGLWLQFDASLRDDMIQSALMEFLDGGNPRLAIWRGLHEQIRLAVFGCSTKRTNRVHLDILDRDTLVSDEISIEDQVDWLRAASRMRPKTDEYRYYVEGLRLHEIAQLCGVTEGCISYRLKALRPGAWREDT